jgi:hypothetical protein
VDRFNDSRQGYNYFVASTQVGRFDYESEDNEMRVSYLLTDRSSIGNYEVKSLVADRVTEIVREDLESFADQHGDYCNGTIEDMQEQMNEGVIMYSEHLDGTGGQWDTYTMRGGHWIADRATGARSEQLLAGAVVDKCICIIKKEYKFGAAEPSKMMHHSPSAYLVEELVEKFNLPWEAHLELCYVVALCEKCTMVAVAVLSAWLNCDNFAFQDCGDVMRRFCGLVDLSSIRSLPSSVCRETSSHMHNSVTDAVVKKGDFSAIISSLKHLKKVLQEEGDDVRFGSKRFIEECSNLPFVGEFFAQSMIAVACITGLLSNCNHAAFARVTDARKPHCRALMEMGLSNLDTVNKLLEVVANRLDLPVKTVENVLCKHFRVDEVREFIIDGQCFYCLRKQTETGLWTVCRKEWGEKEWHLH